MVNGEFTMKRNRFYTVALANVILLLIASLAFGQKAKYLEAPKPLNAVLTGSLKSVRSAGAAKLPVITWGGDIATIYANGGATTSQGSIFDEEGLELEIFREDNFVTQAQKCLDGET